METNQVRFAISSIVKTGAGEIAVSRVDVVQNDVLNRSRNDTAALDFFVRQQEHGAVAHEVLDVLEAELSLDGNIGAAEVVIQVHDVHEADNVCRGSVHLLELVDNSALRHRKRTLPVCFADAQKTGIQVVVEPDRDVGLKLIQESFVCHRDCDVISVFLDCLDRDRLRVLFDVDVRIVLLNDRRFGVGDLFALADALRERHACGLGFQDGARLLFDGAHNAENVAQVLPVPRKAGYKIDFTSGYLNVARHGQVVFCCHIILPFRTN